MTTRASSPDPGKAFAPLFPTGEPDDLSGHAHRQFIGSLGLVLPLLLWVIAGLRPTEGLPRWELLGSVSAYYFTGAVAAFVGILVAMVVCMSWTATASLSGASIFWPEVLALEFFAVSWLLKGRADRTAVITGRRALRYGRHPGQLAGELWRSMQG